MMNAMKGGICAPCHECRTAPARHVIQKESREEIGALPSDSQGPCGMTNGMTDETADEAADEKAK